MCIHIKHTKHACIGSKRIFVHVGSMYAYHTRDLSFVRVLNQTARYMSAHTYTSTFSTSAYTHICMHTFGDAHARDLALVGVLHEAARLLGVGQQQPHAQVREAPSKVARCAVERTLALSGKKKRSEDEHIQHR